MSVLYNDTERYNVVGANVFAQVVFICVTLGVCVCLLLCMCVCVFLLSYDDN